MIVSCSLQFFCFHYYILIHVSFSSADSVDIVTIFIVTIAVLVVLILLTLLIIIVKYCTRRRQKSSVTVAEDRRYVIEEYASVQLSPVSIGSTFSPPVPKSPRPQQPTQNTCVGDPAYAVLDGPTQPNEYSFDPTNPAAGGNSMFGIASIDYAGEEVAPQCGRRNDATTTNLGPLYQVLEDPQNSSLLSHRQKQKANRLEPVTESTNLGPLYQVLEDPQNSSVFSHQQKQKANRLEPVTVPTVSTDHTALDDSVAQPESMLGGLIPSINF